MFPLWLQLLLQSEISCCKRTLNLLQHRQPDIARTVPHSFDSNNAELMVAIMTLPWPISTEYPEDCRYNTLLQISIGQVRRVKLPRVCTVKSRSLHQWTAGIQQHCAVRTAYIHCVYICRRRRMTSSHATSTAPSRSTPSSASSRASRRCSAC